MRLRIAHSTTYRYEPPASSVIQLIRMTPRSHDGQYVVNWQVFASTDTRMQMHHDAFGNITHVLTHGPIGELTINVDGLVETQDTSGVLRGTDERFPPGLFLRPTDLTEVDATMREMTDDLLPVRDDDVLGFLHALLAQIHDHMTFDVDPTHAGTSAADAFTLRRGVCQDYAHIFIACARAGGVPARFVSGHFLRSDGVVQQDAGHAWAEAYVPRLGWVGFDAANGISTTDAHVRVAVGLDYLGAAPVRGTRYGGGAEQLAVAVRVNQAGRQSQSQSQS
ncbi:transglutaminase family protein [Bradyrhizobium sp. U87765 SZCCT0131]|uniref:transglutaminase family protein n=1 Tax=unclassified Bradyrhizobium TaxID=2631580 RepID=UPI001BA7F543|nr:MULTISPECIES: transglutaminase family protein [unclassified Bradyrhizobium]MBR1222896.1 transglutaminase family protein [Bradyrhizobium sp. U87765 SZCCT0131]MBR1262632.1 transglutaminase family protein [Bradyrhizobium sp. U87765 SZCCT0134]MBR1308896.1 transglutaminase family protein [Bradyrhizobium sp. U87765 SZCCT0110]MBR1318414.1 transglutaminase family protein [Bradyrhizobium sp. U87765 SZCCT0109]MBR1352118.1 transglutaminase family protein [Bradyrhizobium sp. U87765 SZCCT0048]